MTALSALLLLLPFLFKVQKIPDESVQSDVSAVSSAISSLDQWNNPREAMGPFGAQLTLPQRALFGRHWVLETIQSERPEAPAQFDLALFAEALEAFVEMDEEAKEVKLRKDALNEWAGVEKSEENEEQKAAIGESENGADGTGTMPPEVRVNENGNFEVVNGAGRDGRMEVSRRKDENGNEQVVVTFLKKEALGDGGEKTQPKAGGNIDLQRQEQQKQKAGLEQRSKMEAVPSHGGTVVPMSVSILPGEKEDGQQKDDPIESFFRMLGHKRRQKRETVVRENVQRTKDGRTIRTIEKLTTLGKPGEGFLTKIVNYTISEDNGWEQPKWAYWGPNQNGTEKSGESESEEEGQVKKEADGQQQNGEQKAEIKQYNDEKGQQQDDQKAEIKQYNDEKGQQQDDQKMEIKQYFDQWVAKVERKKKNLEKLAYLWYSELMYWSSKWIEMLEKRMDEGNAELVERFKCTGTGSAAYTELESEMEKYEAKLAKLKEWIGQEFK